MVVGRLADLEARETAGWETCAAGGSAPKEGVTNEKTSPLDFIG